MDRPWKPELQLLFATVACKAWTLSLIIQHAPKPPDFIYLSKNLVTDTPRTHSKKAVYLYRTLRDNDFQPAYAISFETYRRLKNRLDECLKSLRLVFVVCEVIIQNLETAKSLMRPLIAVYEQHSVVSTKTTDPCRPSWQFVAALNVISAQLPHCFSEVFYMLGHLGILLYVYVGQKR
jgi:hypothetical protein